MKKILLFALLCTLWIPCAPAQQLVLKKGEVMDSVPLGPGGGTPFSLYLPTPFSMDHKWPILVVLDMKGQERQALSKFVPAAEGQGYILMSPKIPDTLTVANSMLRLGEALENVLGLLPIHNDRIYVAGQGTNGRFASLVPAFIEGVQGVIGLGAGLANVEVLQSKRSFHFIGVVSKSDYNYTNLGSDAILLDRLKFPNELLLYEGTGDWPPQSTMEKALQIFTMGAMGRNWIAKDVALLEKAYRDDLGKLEQLKRVGDLLWAEHYMGEMLSIHGPHRNLDTLRKAQRELRRDKGFKTMEKLEKSAMAKEVFHREEYQYALEEDVYTHNFKNLGWWNHQMARIREYLSADGPYERQMGQRLLGFVNALAEYHIQQVLGDSVVDQDALAFLYMAKTILEPDNFDYYMATISLASKHEDFGTALFYLEEAFKRGFKDRERLYALPDTALLRISPDFNELVAQYLQGARYAPREN